MEILEPQKSRPRHRRSTQKETAQTERTASADWCQHLVTVEKLDPDLVWSLFCVLRPHADNKAVSDVRVFNPGQASVHGVHVVDYSSLDNHPELILYHGWVDSHTNRFKLQKSAPDLAA